MVPTTGLGTREKKTSARCLRVLSCKRGPEVALFPKIKPLDLEEPRGRKYIASDDDLGAVTAIWNMVHSLGV